MAETYYCEKCNRTMNGTEFYSSNNLEKYPNDGKFPMCKKCMTMHVDNWNPETYLWILQEADVPYVPDEWNKVVPFSNATPHILLLRLFEEYDETIANAVKEMTSFHKLTYKFEESDTTIKNTFYQVLFGEQE